MQGYDNSATPYVFTDAGISNVLNYDIDNRTPTPFSGLKPHQDKGYVARVIAGTNRGQKAKVVDNDATSWTFDVPFPIDATSIVIIEAAAWEHLAESTTIDNANPMTPSTIEIPTTNAQ